MGNVDRTCGRQDGSRVRPAQVASRAPSRMGIVIRDGLGMVGRFAGRVAGVRVIADPSVTISAGEA